MRFRLLIGGSPCTHWSIAQKNGRETQPEGIGWELFKNFLIAKEKFKPDFFLYENNKSAAQPIKDQISRELCVPLQYINSALVSAQNRQRFYAHNVLDVPQPEDRRILLRDVLETGYPFGTSVSEKGYCLDANYHKGLFPDDVLTFGKRSHAAEPVAVDLQVVGRKKNADGIFERSWEARTDGKSSALTTVESRRMVADPVIFRTPRGFNDGGIKYDKSPTLTSHSWQDNNHFVVEWDGKTYPVYHIHNGLITIKGKQYPIKLADGYYIIRKLTPIECERLQTLPDNYTVGISNTQRYKALGNGWTAEVIIHILRHANIPLDAEIEVLSMYDGIATGRYCLDALGYKNVRYHAYEIDKYPIIVAQKNYPDIIQHGDAFAVRESGWSI